MKGECDKMININTLPHMTLYKMKLSLENDKKINPGCIFVYGKTYQSTLNFIENPKFFKRAQLYRWMYTDFRFRGKIITKPYNLVLREEREKIYSSVSHTGIKPIQFLNKLDGKPFKIGRAHV